MKDLKITTPSHRELAMTRTFDAPRRKVFEAWTKPALLQRWFHGPEGWRLAECTLDPRPGGALRYVWRHEDGREMGMGGTVREVVAPERIVHTELFDEDWTGGETVVTTAFAEKAGRTTVTTTVRYASPKARDGARAVPMEEGVAQSYARLDGLLASAP